MKSLSKLSYLFTDDNAHVISVIVQYVRPMSMEKIMRHLLIGAPFILASSLAVTSHAQDNSMDSVNISSTPYSFTKKRYSISGSAQIVETADETRLVFDEAFKTRGGPDLKVYLSKKSLSDLDNGAVVDNSIKISVLRSKKGAQTYIIPDDIDLSDYKSVLIHCEAFEVLWGGFDL